MSRNNPQQVVTHSLMNIQLIDRRPVARPSGIGHRRAKNFFAAMLFVFALALAALPVSAAVINWGTPVSITGDTDVSATGSALYAYAGGIASGTLTLNGVTFSAGTSATTWGNVSFTSGFNTLNATAFTVGAAPFNTLSTTYSNILCGATYNSATTAGTVTLTGLTVNEAYAVQVWINDPRSAGVSRYSIVSNTVAGTSGAQVLYNAGSSLGSPGQYVIGTFVATATTNQFVLIPGGTGPSAQINAICVRDLGGPNKVWLGSSSTSWGTAGNWSPSGAPISGQSVVFNTSSTANLSTVPDQSYTLGSVFLTNAPGAVSIGSSGYNLNVSSGINVVGASQSLTISDPLVLTASQTFNVANAGSTLSLSGGVSGTAAVTTTGSGTVSLTSAASYTGITTINGGHLLVDSGGSLASLTVSVATNGTLALSGSGSLSTTNFNLAGGSTLDVSAASSTFALSGHLLASTSGKATINGLNDCTSGTLNFTFDGSTPCFLQTNGTMTISSSTVIKINNTGSILAAGSHTIIAAATAGNVGAVAVSDSVPSSIIFTGNGAVGAVSLQIDGSGNLNLVVATPDVWTGAVNGSWSNGGNWLPNNEPNPADSILFNSLSTANLNISQDDTVTGPGLGVLYGLSLLNPSGAVTINGPGSLTVYGGGLNLSSASQNLTITAPLILNADQNWLLTNSRSVTLNGPVSTASGGSVTVSGGGTVIMGAAHILDALTNNATTGDFTVNGSKLDLNGNPQVMNGLNGNTSAVVDNSSVSATTLTLGGNGDGSNFKGVIQNSGGSLGLQVNGGALTLVASSNSYSGGTVFNSGSTLSFSSSSTLGSGPVTFNAGSTSYGGSCSFTNALSLNSCYLRVGGGNLNVQTWSGPISIANGFQMSGDGGAGGVTLSGTLNFGSGGTSITNTGGNGGNEGFGVSLTGDLLSGVISGSGGINYYCNGANSRLTVQGANTYTGGTVVNGTGNGKLNVWGSANPFSTGSVTLNAGAIIESAPGAATVTNALTLNGGILESEPQYNNYNVFTWSGPITLTADSSFVQQATGALNSNQSSGVNASGPVNINGFTLTSTCPVACYGGNTISGSISGSGNILQNGNNALTVSGSNTFTGTFRSELGTLSVGNNYALQNATLDMNSADSGAVSVNNNNVIIGALTGSRTLSLGGGSVSVGNNNASTIFTGVLTNSGSFTKVGTGSLSLSNNYLTGNVTVSGGTLVVAQPTFGNNAVTAVTVPSSGLLKLDFDATNVVANLVLNGVGQPAGIYKAANSGGRLTGIGAIQVIPPQAWSGASSTSWNTPGNWTDGVVPPAGSNAIFSAVSTANLATVLNANFNLGTLQLVNPTGPVSIAAGGANTLTLTNGIDMSKAAQPLTITAPVALGAAQTWTVATNITLSVNGTVSGTSALTVAGTGTVSLGGTNTYTGATTVSSGTLVLAGTNTTASVTISAATNAPKVLATANAALGSGTVTIGGGTSVGATLQVQGGISLNNAITLQTRQTTTGANAVGVENVSGNNTLSGTIAALTAGGNQWVFQSDAGTLTLGTSGSTWISSSTGARGPTFQGAGNFAVVGNIVNGAGTAQLFMSGAGALTLSGANTFSSGVTLNSGTLNIQNATALGGVASIFTIAGTSTLDTSAAGITLTANNTNAWNADFTFAGTGNLNLGAGPVTLNSNRQVTVSAKTLTVGGAIGGAFPLTKAGAGTLALTNASTYSGGTVINAGTLLVNNTTGSGAGTGAVNVNSGGTLGGIGIISGAVTNNANGILQSGVGNIGKLTLNGNVVLLAGSTNNFLVNGPTAVASNTVALGSTITYGGVLNIATNGSFTIGQSFQLFSGTGATNTSNFASIAGSPGTGMVFKFTNGVLSVASSVTGPTLTSVSPNPVTGSSYPVTINLTGTGFTGATAVLLTNLTTVTGFSYVPTVNSSTSISVNFVPGTLASTWNATVVNGTPSSQSGFTVTAPAKVTISAGNVNAAGSGKLVLSGTGGVANDSYAVQSATNLNPPVVWSPVVTNKFDGSGNFSYTNTVNVANPQLFLRIQQ
jgi:fibronectin-binding autotransporter adhesin